MLDQLTGPEAKKLASQIGDPFKKAPHLPKGVSEFLVKISPYLAGLGGVLSILGGLQTLSIPMGYSAVNRFLEMYAGVTPLYWWVMGITSIVAGALLLMAFKPLKARKMEGWMYMFWVELVSIAQMLIGVLMIGTSIVGAVLGALIGLYVLYELKPFYGSVKASKEM